MNILDMPMMEYGAIGAVIFVAAVLQCIAGFGFSLVLMPILVSLQMPLPQAVTLGIICSTVQRAYSIKKLHNHVDWKTLKPLMVVGLVALPIGISILKILTFIKPGEVRMGFGVFILIALGLQFLKVQQHENVPRVWGYMAAFFSGLFNGIANIGGAPIILWILAHKWSAPKMRVTTLAFTLVFVPFQLLILACVFKWQMWEAAMVAAAYVPLVLAATWFGLKIGNKLNKDHIRTVILILLLIIAVVSIINPLLH